MFYWKPKKHVSSAPTTTDLRNFIIRISRWNPENAYDLTKIGLKLLKAFPAARGAILDFFGVVFNDAVNLSINQDEYESDSDEIECLESVNMIGPELCGLGSSWAPIIAHWCINLIVDIATKTQNVPYSVLLRAEPIRVLLDITTQNLTLLIPDERAKFIDMMLGSRACSWAVGWVGRVEPALVAPRALTLTVDAACAVLAPLAGYRSALLHVKAALRDLFQEAIREDAKPENKREVIPYLLNLASKSEIVHKALTQDIEQTLSPANIERLTILCSTHRHTVAWETVTPSSLLMLLTRSNVHCFLLLLRCAKDIVFCRQLLERLLQKLEHDTLYPERKIPLLNSAADKINLMREILLTGSQLEQFSVARILILVSHNLPSEFVGMISYLVQYSRSEAALVLLVRIISGTMRMHTPQGNRELHMDTERYHNNIRTGVEYALRDSMMADMEIKKYFVDGSLGGEQKTYMHHFCLNIIKLMRWENSNRVVHLRTRPFGRAVEANVHRIGGALQQYSSLLRERHECTWSEHDQIKTCHALAEVLDRVDMSDIKAPPPSVEAILKVVQATVNYFFRSMHLKDIMDKLRGVQTAGRLLRKLCIHSELARAVALRALLETAMFREEILFGSRVVVTNTVSQAKDWTSEDLLIYENQKHGPLTQLTQSHTSVFHAGIIGKGVRKQIDHPTDNPPILTANNELLMGALMACMDGNSGIVEGATSLSLLLVELVSPDVMYNGLPWPDEDFTKQVSIERELYMCSALLGCSVARAALRRAAAARPALCLASALLRAPAAATLLRLRATRDQNSQSVEVGREQAALTELLSTMTLGQLLPHPLSHMLELAPQLTAAEIVQMLRDCLWNYTRDHVPAPALFPCDSTGLHWRDPSTCTPPATYTDTLRIIIQKRISKLGHMYPIMFLNLEKDPEYTTDKQAN